VLKAIPESEPKLRLQKRPRKVCAHFNEIKAKLGQQYSYEQFT